MKVLIKKSPVGALSLGYSIGEVVDVKDEKQLKALLDGGFAVDVNVVKKAAEVDANDPEDQKPEPKRQTRKPSK